MGALADEAAYKAMLASAPQRVPFVKALGTTNAGSAGMLNSAWSVVDGAGATPSTAVVPTNATTGALAQSDGGAGQLRALSVEINSGPFSTTGAGLELGGVILLVDRLSHQGGLSGATTSEQTTNLPTAALTRYTSGEGVRIILESYASNTGGDFAVASYTNQDGTSGRATTTSSVGFSSPGNAFILPLQAGDTGVRSVESVTLTGTFLTGNFGVTLVKPLLWIPFVPTKNYTLYDYLRGNMGGGVPEIIDGACLAMYSTAPEYVYSGSGNRTFGILNLGET